MTSLIGALLGAPWRGILPDRRAFVPFRREEGGQASQTRVQPPLWAGAGGVIRPTEATAFGARRRAEKHEVTGQVERLNGDTTNIHAIPFANEEGPIRCMSGLECLFVDRGAEQG